MTPLIDVIFILIVFFLVGSTFAEMEKDLDIKLPTGETSEENKVVKRDLVINVRQDGVIVVNAEMLSLEMLESKIAELVAKDPDQVIQIRADAMAYHKYTVSVMDLCQKHKIRTITIAAALSE